MNKTIQTLTLVACLAGCASSPEVRDEAATAAATTSTSSSTPPSTTEVSKTDVAAPAEPAAIAPTLTYEGFSTPESVLFDAENDVYYVSNIEGSPPDQDGKAFISKLSPEGQVLDLKWIESGKKGVKLNAPKGMAIADGKLFVADIDTVRVFDRKSGKLLKSVKVPKATFLNDVAELGGNIWVSDSGIKFTEKGVEPTGTAGVWLLGDKGKKAPVLVSTAPGTNWGAPNGLYGTDTGIHVVTFGTNELYRINETDGSKADVQTLPKGQLDGAVRTNDGSMFVSSWEAKTIYGAKAGQGYAPAFTGLEAPADIGYDSKRNRLLVPQFMANKVLVFQL